MKLSVLDSKRWLYLALVLLLVVTWFGMRRLTADPYWVDEVISVQRAGHVSYQPSSAPQDIWERTAAISDQVPGYYIVLGMWGELVGTTPLALRYLSVLFGVLGVAIVYQIGRSLSSNFAGFAAALTLASSAYFVLFLHEMRTYSLLICLIAALIWFYWLITNGKRTWWAQVGLVVAAAALMYSYYLSIVVIATICFYHLFFGQKNREWWRVVILMGLAGVLFLPWFLTSFSVLEDAERNFIRDIHGLTNIEAVVQASAAFSNDNIALLGLFLLFGLLVGRRANRYAAFILLFMFALLFVLNLGYGVIGRLRYLLILWVPFAVLAGLGIERLVRWGVPALAISGVIFVAGLVNVLNPAVEEAYDLPIRYLPWDTLVETLEPYESSGDALTFLALIEGDDWEGVHEDRVMPHYFHGLMITPFFIEDVRNLPDADFLREGQTLTSDAERVWLSYAPKLRSWRTGLFEDMLADNGYQACGNFADDETLYLDLHAHPRAAANAPTVTFAIDSDVTAQLASLQPVPTTVNEPFYLIHAWTLAEAFPLGVYSLAVHIYDEANNLVAQADYGLPTDSFACTLAQVPVATLAPGTYEVRSFVYAWADGTRLSPSSGDMVRGDDVILGTFSIID